MKNSFNHMAAEKGGRGASTTNSLLPAHSRPDKGRERAVSQAVSNFDLFQLDGNNQPNMKIERVTVVKARW